jgi:hypothetical protein
VVKWKTAVAQIAGRRGWTSGRRGTTEVAEPCGAVGGAGGGQTTVVDGEPVCRKIVVRTRRLPDIVGQ